MDKAAEVASVVTSTASESDIFSALSGMFSGPWGVIVGALAASAVFAWRQYRASKRQ